MTRDEIRATIEGLEDQSRDGRGDLAGLAIDALTLLRILSGSHADEDGNAVSYTWYAFADLDSERKAVKP